MGRELKRVPLDFNWPIGRVWHGYINPFYKKHSKECPHCEGYGESKGVRQLTKQWYGYVPFDPAEKGSTPFTPDHPNVRKFAERNVNNNPSFYGKGEFAIQLEAERLCGLFNSQWSHHLSQQDVQACWDRDRLRNWSHMRDKETGRLVRNPDAKIPTAKEVNDWSILSGFDGPDSYSCIRAEAKRRGYKMRCPYCKGEGLLWDKPENKRLAHRWKKMHPPKGEGYQLWGTTNEGTPMSPVFETLDELCEWLEPNVTTFGYNKTSKENWKKMLDDGMVVHQEGNMIFI